MMHRRDSSQCAKFNKVILLTSISLLKLMHLANNVILTFNLTQLEDGIIPDAMEDQARAEFFDNTTQVAMKTFELVRSYSEGRKKEVKEGLTNRHRKLSG